MKNEKLYNVFFPIWLIMLFPPVIFLVLPINFIIDSIVLFIGMKLIKNNNKGIYRKTIFKIWGFGFLADIIGTFFLILGSFISNNFALAISYDPFSNKFALIYIIIVVLISGFFIYIFNFKYSFNNTKLTTKNKKFVSLVLAIITMPYIFLFPTKILYKEKITNKKDEIASYLKEYKNIELNDIKCITNSFKNAILLVDDDSEVILKSNSFQIVNNILEINIEKEVDKDTLNKISLLVFNSSNNLDNIKYIYDNKSYLVNRINLNKFYNNYDLSKIILENKKINDDAFDYDFKYDDNYLIAIDKTINKNDFYDLSGNDEFTIYFKYKDMEVGLYEQTLDEFGKANLKYIKTFNNSFSIKCNYSDIMPNVVLKIIYEGNIYEYSPYYSLKDGSLIKKDFVLEI